MVHLRPSGLLVSSATGRYPYSALPLNIYASRCRRLPVFPHLALVLGSGIAGCSVLSAISGDSRMGTRLVLTWEWNVTGGSFTN